MASRSSTIPLVGQQVDFDAFLEHLFRVQSLTCLNKAIPRLKVIKISEPKTHLPPLVVWEKDIDQSPNDEWFLLQRAAFLLFTNMTYFYSFFGSIIDFFLNFVYNIFYFCVRFLFNFLIEDEIRRSARQNFVSEPALSKFLSQTFPYRIDFY